MDIIYRINGGALTLLANQTSPTNIAGTAGDSVEVWLSEKQTATVQAASSVPQITSYNEGTGFGSPFNAAVGASNAGDQIIIIISADSGRTASATDFTATDLYTGSANRTTVLIWDGTGTRPNSSNVSVTLSSSGNYAYQTFVVAGAGTSAITVGSSTSGTSKTGPSITGTANSLLFHVINVQAASATLSAFSPSPSGGLEPARPCTEGQWDTLRTTTARAAVVTLENASAGATTALTFSTSFTSTVVATFEVSS